MQWTVSAGDGAVVLRLPRGGTSQAGTGSVPELGSRRDTVFFKRLPNAWLVAPLNRQDNNGNVSRRYACQAPCLANRAGREALQHGDCLGP